MTRDWKNHYLDYYIHHVTGTVHQWQPILLFPPITDLFYSDYNTLSGSLDISTLGYVIMPEHFHILITSDSGEKIMRFIHGLRRSVSGKSRRLIESENEGLRKFVINNMIDTKAFYDKTAGKSRFRFWKEKPRVFPMNFPLEIQKKLDYIHLNPVRRGLVGQAEDWPHSSIRHYVYEESTRILIGIWPQDVAGKTLPS